MGIPVKRIPTPKRGPNGRLYDELHKAWRAGAVSDFRFHEDGTWTVDVQEGVTTAVAREILADALTQQAISSLEWGPMWMGRRDVIVRTATSGNAAFTELLDRIIGEASQLLVTLRTAQEAA